MTDVKPALTRRERVRETTRTELTAAARELLVAGGVDSVTVRAVAKELGMTAPAIYRYFDSREALLAAVIDLLYDELADVLTGARESRRSGTLSDRYLIMARTFRGWAKEHFAEFALLFGAPIPGVGNPSEGSPNERGMNFGMTWLMLFVEISQDDAPQPEWPRPIAPGLRNQLERYVTSIGNPVSVETTMLYLYCWQSLYGFICTEVFGHLAFALDSCDEMFEDRMLELAEMLGLTYSPPQ